MPVLNIVYAPNEIFRQCAQPIAQVTKEIQQIADDMLVTLEFEKAVGLGANMVGILKRIVVISIKEHNTSKAICMINPEITWKASETQVFEEASLSYPGISAKVTRPNAVKVKYLDYDGKEQELVAKGFLATIVQHEIDYLDGIVFVDYLSKMKREILLKKMKKYLRTNLPHVHGVHCHH